MATETHPIKEAAEEYVSRGYRVIPLHTAKGGCCSCKEGFKCKSAGKHPMRLGWEKAEQLGEAARANFFDGDRPRNLGIVTGPDSGIFVLDVDPKDGGNETMKELVAEHGALPDTLTVKTGSGGWHFFYRYPDFDLGNSAGKLGKGIDTRGKNGFVVAAPSVSGVGPYKVVKDLPVADAPDWILEALRPKERQQTAAPATSSVEDPAEARRLAGYTEGAVLNELDRLDRLHWHGDPAAYTGEPWDHTTFEVACNLIQLAHATWNDLAEGRAYDLFVQHAPTDDGFPVSRVDAKWESALKKVDGEPAAYPPKPMGAWWVEESEVDVQPAPAAPLEPAAPLNPFDAAVAASAGDPPPPAPPRVEVVEFNGIPLIDVRGRKVLDPTHVAKAKAAALGPRYSSRASIEVETSDATFWDIEELVDGPQAGPDTAQDLGPVEDWMRRSLRSGTPDLLWAAVRTILAGVDTGAPTIVLKGGGPLLVLLAELLKPAVGEDPETMLAGPRISTRESGGDEIVFEFDDSEQIDLRPYAASIIMRAHASTTTLAATDQDTHEELRNLPDYRAAQLHRARLGLGSRPRQDGGI